MSCSQTILEALQEKFDYWDEHPDFPLADWRGEVVSDNTRSGYWEWVASSMEAEPSSDELFPRDPTR